MAGFYRKKGEAKELLAKEKDYFIPRHLILGGGEGNDKGFCHADCLFSLWGGWIERAHVTDYLKEP